MKYFLGICVLISLTLSLSSCLQKQENANTPQATIVEEADEMLTKRPVDQPLVDEISGLVVVDAYSLTTSGQNTITVNDFGEMKSISSPLTLTGTAPRSWFQEGNFPITILTLSEEVIASGSATGDWLNGVSEDSENDMIEFEVTLTFNAPKHTDEGKIRFASSNPSGLSENEDLVDTQIIFAEGGSEMIKVEDSEDNTEETAEEEVSE